MKVVKKALVLFFGIISFGHATDRYGRNGSNITSGSIDPAFIDTSNSSITKRGQLNNGQETLTVSSFNVRAVMTSTNGITVGGSTLTTVNTNSVNSLTISLASTTQQGNAFNGANQLIQADGSGLVNNDDLSNSSITKRGQLLDGLQNLQVSSIGINSVMFSTNGITVGGSTVTSLTVGAIGDFLVGSGGRVGIGTVIQGS